jgi:hypothetical protein|uniref:Uncharacterized protein n=1 Tax=Caudovirales sp. ctTqA28 TaxID=2826775 RepID=A0A8S5MDE2_9CAUD|nr:MAG TPA: hypothetical protein [Caudovirales sp. ctTqA28]
MSNIIAGAIEFQEAQEAKAKALVLKTSLRRLRNIHLVV